MRIPLSQFESWILQDNESPYIGTVSAFRHTSSNPIASWVYPILREKPMSSSLSSVPKSLPTSITNHVHTYLPTIYGICVGDFEVGLCLLPKFEIRNRISCDNLTNHQQLFRVLSKTHNSVIAWETLSENRNPSLTLSILASSSSPVSTSRLPLFSSALSMASSIG